METSHLRRVAVPKRWDVSAQIACRSGGFHVGPTTAPAPNDYYLRRKLCLHRELRERTRAVFWCWPEMKGKGFSLLPQPVGQSRSCQLLKTQPVSVEILTTSRNRQRTTSNCDAPPGWRVAATTRAIISAKDGRTQDGRILRTGVNRSGHRIDWSVSVRCCSG